VPLFVHISCHGNDEGLAFGKDSVNWEDLRAYFKSHKVV
jgi:hypothetical protein